jgi:hypothetical protein
LREEVVVFVGECGKLLIYSTVIQLVECQTVNLEVVGAEPTRGAFHINPNSFYYYWDLLLIILHIIFK